MAVYFYIPVASLTTDMSVGLPKPDLSKIADTIFLYKLSRSSFVFALESVISLMTGCRRDSRTRLCSSKNSAKRLYKSFVIGFVKEHFSLNKFYIVWCSSCQSRPAFWWCLKTAILRQATSRHIAFNRRSF